MKKAILLFTVLLGPIYNSAQIVNKLIKFTQYLHKINLLFH